MKREDFYELADEIGMTTVEVTSGRNGYPEGLRLAITGFHAYDDAAKVAREHGLETVILHRRDGWQLWESEGRTFDPIKVTAEMYGDNYELLESMDSREFYDNIVAPRLDGISDVYGLADAAESLKEIWEEIEALCDGEAVLLRDGDFEKVVDVETCEWSHDTHDYVVAVM